MFNATTVNAITAINARFPGRTTTAFQNAIIDFTVSGSGHGIVKAVPGSGKCLGRDTPVLMYDGSVKTVQNVVVGDELMGPDSLPRKVLSLSRGQSELFTIDPIKGDSWICNDVHTLTLVDSISNEVYDVDLNEFLSIRGSRRFEKAKLFRVSVDFPEKETAIPPYLMGVWIGDGTKASPAITNPEPEILEYCQQIADSCGYELAIRDERGCKNIRFRIGVRGQAHRGTPHHMHREFQRTIDEYGQKRIAREYLINSREKRLELLAGIIDTDGYVQSSCIEICTKYHGLCQDILYLARSLGFAAYASEKMASAAKGGETKKYYRISISGELSSIPGKVARKRVGERQQKKNVLRTGFKAKSIGFGDYYGFAVDGDGRFLLGDFTVTHNSSTLEMCVVGLNAVAPSVRGIVLAFNKAIADAMRARLNTPQWDVKTLNSLGHGVLMRDPRFKGATLDTKKTDTLFRAVVGYDQLSRDDQIEMDATAYAVCKMVGLFKSFAVGTVANPLPVSDHYIQDMMDRFDVETPESMAFGRFREILMDTFKRVIECTRVIDFDDQLYMPIRYCMSFPRWYDFVFVDESQDLNMIQLEMVKRMTLGRTRALFVGDEWQAIYGFRGAAADAMQICQETFNATALPLSICWRCPVSVVRAAAEINPEILPSPNAPAGRVETIKKDDFIKKATDGDAVLCRTTAPLVEIAFGFIREGKKAYVKGSDIGAGLRNLLNKIGKRRGDDGIYKKIQTYKNEQIDKCKNEEKLAKILDRLDTLLVLAEECETTAEVSAKIASIFAENRPGICCSTVHKAKGLEFGTVFIVHPELMPHPMSKTPESRRQEMNLKYVAITRAMENLYFVGGMGKAKSKGGKRRKTNPDA